MTPTMKAVWLWKEALALGVRGRDRLSDAHTLRRLAVALLVLGLLLMWVLPASIAFAVGVPLCVLGIAALIGWEMAR